MKLKIIPPLKKKKSDTILISKTGVLRLKNSIAEAYHLDKKDKWILALDEEEKSYKHLYLLKAINHNDPNARKMSVINNAWTLPCPQILKELNINASLSCSFTKIEHNELKGFCLLLN